ncbi:hypothetical protein [Streptomyces sp. UG1]|uniref:hypothetical protein n=1 Tax=Streptomyces sp. UG1 TaxID=3417652 RepID=UPI003CF6D56A
MSQDLSERLILRCPFDRAWLSRQGVVLRAVDAIMLPDAETAVRHCFSTVLAASVIRVAYGPRFARPVPVDDDAFTADPAETAVRYLLAA